MTSVKMGSEDLAPPQQKVTREPDIVDVDIEAKETPQKHDISVYQEARECLNWATFAYIIAEFRAWSKEGKFKDNEAAFNLPLTVQNLRDITNDNVDFIEEVQGKDRVKLINNILTYMESNQEGKNPDSTQIVLFEDSRQGNDLVYFIAVNNIRKTVDLVFRGTVTQKDLLTDVKAVPWKVPVENCPVDSVTVHKGFYDYLFQKLKSNSSGRYVITADSGVVIKEEESVVKDDKGGTSEIDQSNTSARTNDKNGHKTASSSQTTKYEIIKEQLSAILTEHPDYELYVTGHSLGGALCTLFSGFAIYDPDLPSNMTCISFASPKVGSQAFLRMVKAKEDDGSLRFLRIANNHDPITNVPKDVVMLFQLDCFVGGFSALWNQKTMFRHVGMELRLYKYRHVGCCGEKGVRFFYLPNSNFRFCPIFWSDFLKIWKRAIFFIIAFILFLFGLRDDYRKYHGFPAYMLRLNLNRDALEDLRLDDLYLQVKRKDYRVIRPKY